MQNGFRAGGTIQPSTFVKLSTSADNEVIAAGAGDRTIGIATPSAKNVPAFGQTLEAADSGDPVTLFGIGEITILQAGSGGFAHGDLLKSDSNGAGVTATTGDNIGAMALQTTPQGAFGRVQCVIFKN